MVLGVALIVKPLKTQSSISSSITDDHPISSAVSDVLVKRTSPLDTFSRSFSSSVHSTSAVISFFLSVR